MKSIFLTGLFFLWGLSVIAQFDPSYNEESDDNQDKEDTVRTTEDVRPSESGSETLYTLEERIYLGGNLGLNLGTNFFFADLSPLIGYDLVPQVFSVGIGGTYRFRREFGQNFNEMAVRVFSRFNIEEFAFVHVEYEYLSYIVFDAINLSRRRIWQGNILAGGGVWLNKSDRGGFYISILYALTADSQNFSYYRNNPWVISPGFIFYLQ